VVAICGDEPRPRSRRRTDSGLGGRAAVVGGFASARQFEEATGFVMRVVASRHNPMFAISHVDRPLRAAQETTEWAGPVTALAQGLRRERCVCSPNINV
jgi:8-hydroxy-5-deazaflavin:NADPH oxidoreductase